MLPLLFMACKKDQAPTGTNITFQVPAPGPSDSTDIIGHWELVASRLRFSVLKPDTSWGPADTVHARTIISFTAGKVFSYNSNYVWSAQQYDRYKTVVPAGLVHFSIYATVLPTGNIGVYQSVTVQQINKDALLISYMSTDIARQEIYVRAPNGVH